MALYLQVSGLGPMLGSGLWLILSERFDPHSAKRYFGQIAGAGTLGGLAGGLLRGLRDERFDVRFQCARSLAAIVRANPQLRIDREAIFAIVERELVRDRASRSIGLLVTILSLVLPAEPLRIAFQGLRSGDPGLRGTAQEYLEGVLPPAIRERLFKGYAPN